MTKAIDFGVIPDGIYGATGGTDNLAALNNAFAAMAASGDVELELPKGICNISGALSVTTPNNLVLSGRGSGAAYLQFTGTAGGVSLKSSSYNVGGPTAFRRPHFAVHGVSLLTLDTAGTQTALSVELPYWHSSQHRELDVDDVVIEAPNATAKWANGIVAKNAWNAKINNVTGNSKACGFGAATGSMVILDGLAPAARISQCEGQWWNAGAETKFAVLTNLAGSTTGSFLYHEPITGPSGSGRIAELGYAGSSLTLTEITGAFNAGQTLTGAISGASITLSSAGKTVVQANEGMAIDRSSFVCANYGILSLMPPKGPAGPLVAESVGLWVSGSHFNVAYAGVYTGNTYQVHVSDNLIYLDAPNGFANAAGVRIHDCIDFQVHNNIIRPGGGTGTRVGIALVNAKLGNATDNKPTSLAVGLSGDANCAAVVRTGNNGGWCTTPESYLGT